MNKVKKQLHDLIDSIPDGEGVLQVVYESLVVYNDKSHNEITNELNLNQQKRLEDSIKKSSLSSTISDSAMQQEIKKWSSR